MSVVKRRCGEALATRLDETQRAQALLRGLLYNIQRLVRLEATAQGSRQSKAFGAIPSRASGVGL